MSAASPTWENLIDRNEGAQLDGTRRLKVPGGWLYQVWKRHVASWGTPVFVAEVTPSVEENPNV